MLRIARLILIVLAFLALSGTVVDVVTVDGKEVDGKVVDGHTPLITEFMASNGTTLADEDGDFSDWIELHNPTDEAVDLSGWSLTDDASEPAQWTFANATLQAGEYLVVFASGKNRQPGASNWNSVVRRGDLFRYFPGTEAVAEDWYEADFDDSSWDEGPSSLGYENSSGGADIQTSVPDGIMALYARATFTVDDPGAIQKALLHVDYDDGFIAYVNGQEVARGNMSASDPTHQTPADGLHEAVLYQGGMPEEFDIPLPASVFQAGTNVLAIEVHNANQGSSDLTLVPFLTFESDTPAADGRGLAPELSFLENSAFHTNFSLSRDGEYLGLFDPDGVVVSEFAPYPEQRGDVSYGHADGGATYFTTPTPGAPNASGSGGIVDAPTFSAVHGLYEAPFSLFLFPETSGSTVRYTLDGSEPTDSTGRAYTNPLRIEETTVVRAAAFREGAQRSDVVTRTYIFPADVLGQSPDGRPPKGWPSFWGSNHVDYGMDPNVVESSEADVIDALGRIPSFSLVMPLDSLFSPTRGIYSNALSYGRDWERPGSVELMYPEDFPASAEGEGYHGPRSGFQANAGIRIRGGWSRNDPNPKHAFRIFFRGEYGEPLLSYPLFGDEGADEFDKFDLRTSQNYSWAFTGDARNTMLRDVFARDLQRDIGVPYTRSRYYHLYVNGQYWGLFQTQERADHHHGATYIGGDADDFDVVKSAGLDNGYEMEMTSGTVDAWRELYNGVNTLAAAESEDDRDAWYMRLQGLDPDGSRNASYPVLLDADNLIQYMLVIFWTGNPDAPITPFMGTNNFFGYRDRTGDHGFKWFAHDSEHALLDPSIDRTGPFPAGDQFRFSNPQWIHQQLMGSREYRIRFADFAHRHLFDGGAMTTGPSVARMEARKAEIEDVLISESARWGDAQREPPRGLADWNTEVARLRNGILPARRDVLLGQLQSARRFERGNSDAATTAAPLYPSVDAPAYSHHGGEISGSDQVTVDAPSEGTVYYTLDGSDPRLPGGGVSENAVEYDGEELPLAGRQTVIARFLSDGGEWSARSETEYVVDAAAPSPGALVISEIYYHPPDPTPEEEAAGVADGNDFEFIELHNRSDRPLALAGLSFTNGIDFSFGPSTLAPGARTVLVSDSAAFRARFGTDSTIGGMFEDGRLSNGGERVTLSDRSGEIVFTVDYGDGGAWPSRADGAGSSLALDDEPILNARDAERADRWLASAEYHGSPGSAGSFTGKNAVVDLVVNEILSHTDPPEVDAVEFYNTSSDLVDLSGWFLSDGLPFDKYRIPDGTTVDPGDFIVFDESDFNASGTDSDFALDGARGDEIWLVETDADGRPVRFVDHVVFGPARNGEAFGRTLDGSGRLAPMSETTLGHANAAPRVGSVVVREIMYHPPGNNENLEYVGIYNAGMEPEDLTAWTIREAVDFTFPEGLMLGAGDSLYVVAFDPENSPEKAETFRAAYGWAQDILMVGGWDGRLANDGEMLVLNRPDEPPADDPDFVPETLEERVTFGDAPPWPQPADGRGSSLFRRDVSSYSDDPAAWGAMPRPFVLYAAPEEPEPDPLPTGDNALTPVYPNPAQTHAESVLTVRETQLVRVELYDMLGRRLRVLYDGSVSEGSNRTITVNGAGLASGIYLLRATGRSFSVTRTVTFVR